MDIKNVNSLNVRLNIISGNLLPMTADDSSFPIFWKIYSILIWLLEIVQICALISGCTYVPKENALRDGMIGIVVTIEVIFLVVQIHARKKLVQRLIQKLNDILHVDDEIMRNTVMNTIKPIDIPLKFCWIVGVTSIFLWTIEPFIIIFQRDMFFYVDYRMPVVFSKEPFSISIFILGNFVVMISSMYIFTKKISVDSYMINLILLITAQYKYIALKLSMIFYDEIPQINHNSINQNEHYFKMNYYAEKQIKSICRHHNAVICISSIFNKLLSLNFNLIYIISVFRFCSIIIMIISIPSITLWDAFGILMYACSGMVQLYIFCSCVQQLLDASMEMTDQAFYEEWYESIKFKSIKRTFMLMIMANNLKLKLSMFKEYNLSLPSFTMILNQSYAIALILLRIN